MAVMPNVQWRPLPSSVVGGAMKTKDIVCVHTMVGSLEGTDGMFRKGGSNSHFGTDGYGTIRQWVDTDRMAYANLDGNWHIISIENADVGAPFPKWNTNDGAAVPDFTDAQVEAIAQIIAWACRTHNIPCQLVPDAKPGRRGIAYHRQGVPGYMVAGAEKWSSARGKVCPGDRRINTLIKRIIPRAQEILGQREEGDSIVATMNADQLNEYMDLQRRQTRALEHLDDLLSPGVAGQRNDGKVFERVRWLHENSDREVTALNQVAVNTEANA